MVRKIITGSVIFIILIGAGIKYSLKTKQMRNEISQKEKELNIYIPPQQKVFSIEKLKYEIVKTWRRKADVLNLNVSFSQEKERGTIPKIGLIKGEKIVLKIECPVGLEKTILQEIEKTKRAFPVVVDSLKMTEKTVEVGLIIYGT